MVVMLLFFWSQDLFLQLFDSKVMLLMVVTSFSNIFSFALLACFGRGKMYAMYQRKLTELLALTQNVAFQKLFF